MTGLEKHSTVIALTGLWTVVVSLLFAVWKYYWFGAKAAIDAGKDGLLIGLMITILGLLLALSSAVIRYIVSESRKERES